MTTPTYRSETLEQVDSRRLPGRNLFFAGPAAILDVAGREADVTRVIEAWRRHARALLDEVGWSGESLAQRQFRGGANLVLSAPLDALFAATELNEAAFARARAEIGSAPPAGPAASAEELRAAIDRERRPELLALREECARRGVAFVADDERVSVGLGAGSITFERAALPAAGAVDWARVRDVPVCMVTGTNGKSTTVRLVAAMARAAGLVAGVSSTDWVRVGEETLERGDWSGPGGARLVLRDRRVEAALLETARGGMLRRGLALDRADAAAVTNVSEDHIGEFGVAAMDDLVDAKLVIRRAVGPGGRLVLNAHDERLVARSRALAEPVAWFARDPELPHVRAAVDAGGDAAWVEDGALVLRLGAARASDRVPASRRPLLERVVALDDVPIALRGAARHNVENALAALLLGALLGFAPRDLAAGLREFLGDPAGNPGRGNVFDLGGVTAIVDFAHNPDGVRAVMEMAQALPARRRLVVIGQAGDRDDDAIRALARATAGHRPDHVVLKEMERYLRGRAPGTIPALLESELLACGLRRDQVTRAASESEAVDVALEWARAGDLLILLTHAERRQVLEKLESLRSSGWHPRA